MTPVEPLERDGFRKVVFAKDQPEYLPLPALTDGQYVITRWKLSWRERLTCLVRGDLHLGLLTFGRPLQPIRMSVTGEL